MHVGALGELLVNEALDVVHEMDVKLRGREERRGEERGMNRRT